MSRKLPSKANEAGRWVGFALAVIATIAIAVITNRDGIQKREYRVVEGYEPWDEEIVKIAKGIPVQEGGRIKPFSTRAGFLMLKLHGARSMTIKDGEGKKAKKIRISPTEWLLDALFRPELAMKLPTFRVDNSDLLKEAGIEVEERRDRYSYADLEPALGEIGRKAGMLQEEIEKQRQFDPDFELPADEAKKDPRELAQKIFAFQGMLGALDFARMGMTLDETLLPELESKENMRKVSFWLKSVPTVGAFLRQQGTESADQIPPHVNALLQEIGYLMMRGSRGIEWLPPYEAEVAIPAGGKVQVYSSEGTPKSYRIEAVEGEVEVFEGKARLGKLAKGEAAEYPGVDLSVRSGNADATVKLRGKEWMPVGQRYFSVSNGPDPGHWALLAEDAAKLENLVAAHEQGPKTFAKELEGWRGELLERAAEPKVAAKLKSELTYYWANYFFWALALFLLAFIVTATGWLSPATLWGKITTACSWVLGGGALGLVVAGIAHRSILMGRPPVGNLYDTIPFIAAGGVLLLFLLEAKTRRKFALGAAVAVGLFGMFLARMFEGVDAQDHMDPLRAVLRSNFWLSTHVVIITLGYCGGLIAAAMSHVYLYARAFGLDRADRSLRRFLTRSVYGLVCFTLLFSLVGTVLGGIWANDSWGRFWGWDPKENGALMIVLWSLIILHARLGGYLKEWGLHIASVFGAVIVAFSWWGVNLLGAGLHSYGFTEGLGETVMMFYIFEACVAAGGIVLAVLDRAGILWPDAGKEATPPPPAPLPEGVGAK